MGIQEQYRKEAAELLSSGAVKLVIGYGEGTTADRRRPVFIRSAEYVGRLVLDANCVANLSAYLVQEGLLSDGKKVAAFLKPEGIRSMNILAAEAQLDPEQVVILGFDIEAGQATSLSGRNASDFTALIGSLKASGLSPELQKEADRLEHMGSADRFEYWKAQFSKCIKCYACRQVCPMCYCRRCIVDVNQPQWINTSSHTLGNFEWNIIRAFHLAGRCVACGGCDRSCPVNIPLRLINHRMAKEALDTFGHFAGESADQKPVLATFRQDDPETFIL
ncbi:MAG: 4Fe-4S ferredoxin [Chlorobiaceae bacterium]|nr:4Fe-4S ferredoxin [Chlorobiaceae bacterium]